jgi:hypothetical protein
MRVYSRTLAALNDYNQAIKFAQTSVNTALHLLGESHSFRKTCRKNLAQIYREKGDTESADAVLTLISDSLKIIQITCL